MFYHSVAKLELRAVGGKEIVRLAKFQSWIQGSLSGYCSGFLVLLMNDPWPDVFLNRCRGYYSRVRRDVIPACGIGSPWCGNDGSVGY